VSSLPQSNGRDTVLVFSLDYETLQVIREFLEPLGFAVEFAPAADTNPVETDGDPNHRVAGLTPASDVPEPCP
jgi:hypothetical protein